MWRAITQARVASTRRTDLFTSALRFKNKWTNDPVERFQMKKKAPMPAMGNRARSEEADNFPERPLEHSQSPYLAEHPQGIPSTFLDANTLKDNPGARRERTIVGRGPGSGKGKTSAKGHKGQRARAGGSTRPGFEGGSNSLYKAVRKYGFRNRNKIDYQELNLNQLQLYLDTGRLVQPTDRPLTIRDLKDSGIFRGLNKPVKILGNGKQAFQGSKSVPLNIEVQAITQSAREAIESTGGTVTTVYFNDLGLFHFLKRPHDSIHIRFARAPAKKAFRYDVPVYTLPGQEPDEDLLPASDDAMEVDEEDELQSRP